MLPRRSLIPLSYMATLVANAPAAQRTFVDGDFAPADWGSEVVLLPISNGASAVVTLETDGNPGNCRRHSLGVDADAGDLVALVSRFGTGFDTRYEAAVDGEIVSIDYAFDVRASGASPLSARYGIALKQASVIYVAQSDVFPVSSGWQEHAGIGLTSTDFVRVDGEAGNPDFTLLGAPIRFCFVSLMTSAGAPAAATIDFDNFYLRTWTACPADLDDGSGTGTTDGGVDINDLLYFLARFELGDVAADLDDGSARGTPDGGVDINDLLFFLSRFERGC